MQVYSLNQSKLKRWPPKAGMIKLLHLVVNREMHLLKIISGSQYQKAKLLSLIQVTAWMHHGHFAHIT